MVLTNHRSREGITAQSRMKRSILKPQSFINKPIVKLFFKTKRSRKRSKIFFLRANVRSWFSTHFYVGVSCKWGDLIKIYKTKRRINWVKRNIIVFGGKEADGASKDPLTLPHGTYWDTGRNTKAHERLFLHTASRTLTRCAACEKRISRQVQYIGLCLTVMCPHTQTVLDIYLLKRILRNKLRSGISLKRTNCSKAVVRFFFLQLSL